MITTIKRAFHNAVEDAKLFSSILGLDVFEHLNIFGKIVVIPMIILLNIFSVFVGIIYFFIHLMFKSDI